MGVGRQRVKTTEINKKTETKTKIERHVEASLDVICVNE